MSSVIVTDVVPFYDEVVNLEGTYYHLSFRYSQREDCYYLSIGTPEGDDIVNGIKIVPNWPLTHKYAESGLPPGDLICVPNTNVDSPAPGLGQIGANLPFTLVYVPFAELP